MTTVSVTTFLCGTSVALTANPNHFVRDLCKDALKRHKSLFSNMRTRRDITYNSIVAIVNLTKLRLVRRDSPIKRQIDGDTLVWLVHSSEWDAFAERLNAKDNPTRNGKAVPYKYPSSLASHQLLDFVKDFCIRNSIDDSHDMVLDPRIVTQLSRASTPPPDPGIAGVAEPNFDLTSDANRHEDGGKGGSDEIFPENEGSEAVNLNEGSTVSETPMCTGSDCGLEPKSLLYPQLENGYLQQYTAIAESKTSEILEDAPVHITESSELIEAETEDKVKKIAVVDDALENTEIPKLWQEPLPEASFTFDVSDDDEETATKVEVADDGDNGFNISSSGQFNDNAASPLDPLIVSSPILSPPKLDDEDLINENLSEGGDEVLVNDTQFIDVEYVGDYVNSASGSVAGSLCPSDHDDTVEPDRPVLPNPSTRLSRDNSHEDILNAVLKQKEELDQTVSQLSSLITNLSADTALQTSPQKSPVAVRRPSPLRSPRIKVDSDYKSPISLRNKLRNRILARKLGNVNSAEGSPTSFTDGSPMPVLNSPEIETQVAVQSPQDSMEGGNSSQKTEEVILSPANDATPNVSHSRLMPITESETAQRERTLHLSDTSLWTQKLVGSSALMRRRASMGSVPATKVSISLTGIDSPREESISSTTPKLSVDSPKMADEEEHNDKNLSARWAPFSLSNEGPKISPIVSKKPNMPRLAIEEINSPPPPPPHTQPWPEVGDDSPSKSIATQTEPEIQIDSTKLLPVDGSPIIAEKTRSPQNQGDVPTQSNAGLLGSPPKARRSSVTVDKSNFVFDTTTGSAVKGRSKSVLITSPELSRSADKETCSTLLPPQKLPPRIMTVEDEPNTARDGQIGKLRLPPAALFFADFFYGADLLHCRQMLAEQRPSTASDSLADEERKRLNAMIIQRIRDVENRLLSTRYVWPGTLTYQASVKCLATSILSQCDDNLFGKNSMTQNISLNASIMRGGSFGSEKFRRSISKACGPPDSMDDVLVLWSCFQLFGKFEPGGNLTVSSLSLPQVLSILQQGGVLPFFEKSVKSPSGETVVKRVFNRRYNLEWLSLEFQKTQPSNYAEILKSRKVKQMAETILLGPRSVLQTETRTPQANVTPLVPGGLETYSYIEHSEYNAAVFNKYKSPAIIKAIQAAKTATKISFYRFVQFVKNLSVDRIYIRDLESMRHRRERGKEKRKKEKPVSELTKDASGSSHTPTSEPDSVGIHEEVKVELDDIGGRDQQGEAVDECSLGSAAFDLPSVDCNNNSVEPFPAKPETYRIDTSRSHSFSDNDRSDDESDKSIASISDFASDQESAIESKHHSSVNLVASENTTNSLEHIMLKLRVLLSKVDINHLHLRCGRLSTRNIAAREEVFRNSTVLEATRHLGGGLSLTDITNGILALRGGALDDPEVCYSGAIRSFSYSAAVSLSPVKLWADWEKNIVQLQQIYSFYASCADKSIDMLHGKMLSHRCSGANTRYFLSLDQCRTCLHTFGVLPSYLDTMAFFRLFRAVKRWEWSVGYTYLAGASAISHGKNDIVSARDSVSPGSRANTSVMKATAMSAHKASLSMLGSMKRIPFSPCKPDPAPGASPTRRPMLAAAEAYPNPSRKKTDFLVNPKIDGTQYMHNSGDSVHEAAIDQTFIHDCASTIGLSHMTFGGFIELLCRIGILIFGHQGNVTNDNSAADESAHGIEIKRCAHNLLRLMDESGGKQVLLNKERKSVVIRKFQF